jgi:hypothetical protein
MADPELMAQHIKTILSKVPGIKSSFDHEPQSMNILPAATIYFDGFGQVENTTMRKEVNWRWIIRIYIPIRTSDIRAPQVEVRKLTKDTLSTFSQNPTLNGSCLYHTISDGDIFAMMEQTNPMMVAELTLAATTKE